MCLVAGSSAKLDLHIPSVFTGSSSGVADRAKKGEKKKGHGICHDPSLRDLPPMVGLVRDIRNRDALKTLRDKHKIKFGSCAVVGNAGTMQATAYGAVIDSHDVVFRLNQAPTKGYESIVGSRATFRLINKEWVTEWAKDQKWLPREDGLVLITRGDNEVRLGRKKYTHILGVSKVKKDVEKWSRKSGTAVMQFNKSLAAAAWKKILAFQKCTDSDKKCDRCKATSGMLAIMSSVILCENVTVYGMGGSRFAGEYPYHYYKFRGTELTTGYSGHLFDVEKALVAQYAKRGYLTLCGPGDAKVCGTLSVEENPCCNSTAAS
uniref:beta-galactoside alpha-(2,6)-sialyltransferase n=1 Tax=Chloropicon primus TaxID=1764295 RepID=A0A7S2SWJ5_9CHLO